MKSILRILFAVFVLGAVGCGVQGTPPSADTGPVAPEDTTKQIEEAAKSGKIDMKTYGKY